MRVTVDRRSGDVVVLQLHGQLDIDSGASLEAALARLLAGAESRIVVDLSGLAFCDSTGLSALLLAQQHCRDNGGFLRLAAPAPFLLRVLTVVGLRAALPVYRSVAAARAGDPGGLMPAVP
jgi:anti-sigma B factor antagonist